MLLSLLAEASSVPTNWLEAKILGPLGALVTVCVALIYTERKRIPELKALLREAQEAARTADREADAELDRVREEYRKEIRRLHQLKDTWQQRHAAQKQKATWYEAQFSALEAQGAIKGIKRPDFGRTMLPDDGEP